MCRHQHRESSKMKNHAKMSQTKEQDKSPETDLNAIELYDLPDREFRVVVIKMLTKVQRAHEPSENFNRETENTK